jgi:hypothetical protein
MSLSNLVIIILRELEIIGLMGKLHHMCLIGFL